MSGEEEVKQAGKTVDMTKKMTPEQQAAAEKAYRKQQATQLSEYKKRLRSNVELKELQVRELHANIQHYEFAKKWKEMQPEVMEFEAQEQAEMQERDRRQRELIEKQRKEAEEKANPKAEKKPEIVIPKVGKPREV